jgi:hypothetical protein
MKAWAGMALGTLLAPTREGPLMLACLFYRRETKAQRHRLSVLGKYWGWNSDSGVQALPESTVLSLSLERISLATGSAPGEVGAIGDNPEACPSCMGQAEDKWEGLTQALSRAHSVHVLRTQKRTEKISTCSQGAASKYRK